jgi:hypothetical protein
MKTWKKHPIYPLAVSVDGRVARLGLLFKKTYKKIYVAKQNLNKGYFQVSLNINGKKITRKTHRLVVETFLGLNPQMQVNHIDHNKLNNHIENLEWCTQSENTKAAYKFYGEKYKEKINKNRKKPVIRSDGKAYESVTIAAIENQCTKSNIRSAIKTKTKCKLFYWDFNRMFALSSIHH